MASGLTSFTPSTKDGTRCSGALGLPFSKR
jgi:hypothetical protein